MDERIESNRALWDEWTGIHVDSRYYDVDGFRAGKTSLLPLELAEVGDVNGESLLHLQCHFGMDTLSWARRGPRVTGVNFSERAIAAARALATDTGIAGDFVTSDVYALPDVLTGSFNVVYATYGVLPWLPDFARWAQVAAHFLAPGGVFYLADLHPIGRIFDERYPPVVSDSYFRSEPKVWTDPQTYADESAPSGNSAAYLWLHSLGDVVTSLIQAGLIIEYVHEFPYCMFQRYPWLSQREDGFWYAPQDTLPLLFSIRATKPA